MIETKVSLIPEQVGISEVTVPSLQDMCRVPMRFIFPKHLTYAVLSPDFIV